MRRRLLFAGAVLITAIPLVLALRGYVREAILPSLTRLLWTGRIFINIIPQPLLWIVFLLIASILAARSLIVRRKKTAKALIAVPAQIGRVQHLIQIIQRNSQGSYFKWRLARHLANLTLETPAYREKRSLRQMRQFLESEELGAPREIEDYLLAGLNPNLPPRSHVIARMRQRVQAKFRTPPLDLDPEIVVRFLEKQLEISHDI